MGVALAVASLAATAIGTGLQVAGQMQQARASRQQANYQAQVATINAETSQRNARLADTNAAFTEAAGARSIDDRARRIRQTIGAQRAAFASNGLMLDSGTAADVTQDTAELGDLAIFELRENAGRQGSGFRIQGVNAREDARMAGVRGVLYQGAARDASTAGWLAAGGSLIGGATRTFDRWADMYRTGVPMPQPPMVT
jgi:hypothetical protein